MAVDPLERRVRALEKKLALLTRENVESVAGITWLLDVIIRLLDANGALKRADLAAELRLERKRLGERQWEREGMHAPAAMLEVLKRELSEKPRIAPKRPR